MSSAWYYGLDSKVHGPVDTQGLQTLFQKGTLKKTDLILKDGESDWKSAMDWPDLQSFFQQRDSLIQDSVPLPQFNEKWDSNSYVVLFHKLGSSTATQDGPFSLEEVKKMLQEKTLSTEDKIWQKTFSEWKTIGQLPELDVYHWKLDSQRQESLSSVAEYEKPAEKPVLEKDDFLARLDRWEADLEPQSQVSFKLPKEKQEEDFLGENAYMGYEAAKKQLESVAQDKKRQILIKQVVLTVISLVVFGGAGFFAFQQYQELQRKAELLSSSRKVVKNPEVSKPTPSVETSTNTASAASSGSELQVPNAVKSGDAAMPSNPQVQKEMPAGVPSAGKNSAESMTPSLSAAAKVESSSSVKKSVPEVDAKVKEKLVEKPLPLKLKMETKKSFKEVQILFQNLPSKTDKIFYVLKGKEKTLASLGGYRKKGSEKVKDANKFQLQFSLLPLGKYTLTYHGPEIPESEFQMDVGTDTKAWKMAMGKLGAQKTKARTKESFLLKEKIQQHLLWVNTTKKLLNGKKKKLSSANSSLQKLRVGPLHEVEKNVSTLILDEVWMQLNEISKDLQDLLDGDDLSQTNLQEVQKDLLSMLKKLK